MNSTDTRAPYALTPAQRAIVQRAAWGLLRAEYESYMPDTKSDAVRAYSREVDVRITKIKGERRGAAPKASVEKLIREGILSRPFRSSVVRVTAAGKAALYGRPAPAPVSAIAPVAVPAPVVETSEPATLPKVESEALADLAAGRLASRNGSYYCNGKPVAYDSVSHRVISSLVRTGLAERGESGVLRAPVKYQPRRKPFEADATHEVITSTDGGLSYSLIALPEWAPEDAVKAHEKKRATMLKNAAKRNAGAPKWKPFGKGQITLKARKAPKTDRIPADILKDWSGEVIHDVRCYICGEFDACSCVRDIASAKLAELGGPIVDADGVARGSALLSGTVETTVRHECAGQITLGEDVPESEEPVCADPLLAVYPPLAALEVSPDMVVTELAPGYARVTQWGAEYRIQSNAKGRVTRSYAVTYPKDAAIERDVTWAHALSVITPGSFAHVSFCDDRDLKLIGVWEDTQTRCQMCEAGWAWGRGRTPKLKVRVMGKFDTSVCNGSFHGGLLKLIPKEFTEGLDPVAEAVALVEYAEWVQGTGPEPMTAAERMAAKAGRRRGRTAPAETTTTQQGENIVGRGSLAPKRKVESKVSDILFATDSFPTTALLLGHHYTVTLLAGSYSVTHNASRENLVFTGTDKKGICPSGGQYFPTRPEMKKAILADAVARGEAAEVEEHQDQAEPVAEPQSDAHLPRPMRLALERDTAEELCGECEQYADECVCHDPFAEEIEPERESEVVARFPELARWLTAPSEGERKRVLNLFCGPGGVCVALRQGLNLGVDMLCVDKSADAVKTQQAAGCWAIRADVTTLDPYDPVFAHTTGAIITAPCTDYTDAGKRWGRLAANIDLMGEMWDYVRHAAGRIPMGDGHEHAPNFGVESSFCEPSGATMADARTEVSEAYEGNDGFLMLEIAVWVNGLKSAGAPLEWVAVEQSSKLPEEITGEIRADFQLSGWAMADVTIADAAEYGAPAHRVRTLIVARLEGTDVTLDAPGITTGLADGTGLPEGTVFTTRGARKTSGGNLITVTDQPGPSPTSRARSWDMDVKGGRMTVESMAKWVSMPQDHPVQGSRTSVFQQLADVVMPVMGIALLGMATGTEWRPALGRYLAKQYPALHADTEEISVEVPAGESGQEISVADTEEVSYGLRDGERIRYVGGHESEYAVMLAGDPERWVCGVGADGERMEGDYTFVGPWSHGGKAYSVRYQGKRFASAETAADILPAVRKHAAKNAPAPVKPEPVKPGLYAPVLHVEEGREDKRDECEEDGHRYRWLCVEAEGVSRTLRSYLACGCGGEKLGNFGRSGPSMNQGTQSRPLGIRDASIASALGVASRNSYTCKGPWVVVSEALKRCPVVWDHAESAPVVAVDPAREQKSGVMARLLGENWKPLEATADPVFEDDQEEQPVYAGPLTREQRKAAWRIAAGESAVAVVEPVEDSAPADMMKMPLALEAAPVRLMLEAAPVVLPDTGRGCWEIGARVSYRGSAGRVVSATVGKTIVSMDGAEPGHLEHLEPRALWVEGTEPKPEPLGWFSPVVEPEPLVDVGPDYAELSAAHREARREELEAELLTKEMRFVRPAFYDDDDYELAPPESVDVLTKLTAELLELRRDVEEWGAEVAALAVAEAERVVAEVARDMLAAELLELRREAVAIREALELEVVPVEVPQRVRPRRALFATAVSLSGLLAAGWSEGWSAGMRG
ncbi:hypothetical protein [Streptomyces sp. NPDC048340]|uniref:hypothetical protein n=1 Tax=Streptomyces sp. NPDC048340 TaxID=3365537 RepID=UPI00371BECC4